MSNKLFNHEKIPLPIICDWYGIHKFPSSFHTWPRPLLEYQTWLKRVSTSYKDEWKEWGIHDIIMLLAVDMHWSQDVVLIGILQFWLMTINGFVLPKAMVGLTLLEEVTILNFSIHIQELSSLYESCFFPYNTLGINFSKDNSRYSIFLLLNAKKSDIISSGSKSSLARFLLISSLT